MSPDFVLENMKRLNEIFKKLVTWIHQPKAANINGKKLESFYPGCMGV
jgi:hypothetical protein